MKIIHPSEYRVENLCKPRIVVPISTAVGAKDKFFDYILIV